MTPRAAQRLMNSTLASRYFSVLIMLALLVSLSSTARPVEIKSTGQASMTDIAEWRVFGDGGWAKVEKGHVRFYSSSGQHLKSIELRGKEVLAAPFGGDVLGVLLYADRQPMTLTVVRFDIYDAHGKRQLRLDNPWFDRAIVSPNGDVICGVSGAEGLPQSVLRFYDGKGRQQDTLTVKRFRGGRFSRDGSRFAFLSGSGHLSVTDDEGQVLHDLGSALKWDMSADGRVVGIADERLVRFYLDGSGLSAMPWHAGNNPIRNVSVSPDGRHALVLSAYDAAVMSVDPLEVLWELKNDDTAWNYRSGSITDNAEMIAIGADFDPGSESGDRHNKSRCFVYDSKGGLLSQFDRQPQNWTAAYPVVAFSSNGRTLLFRDRDGMTRLTISP